MKKIVALICIILFLIPFFWFQPGQMDLGGDASRLYFYDPFAYLINYALYSVSPSGFGVENIGFFAIPFTFALYCVRSFTSATFLIAGFHGISLTFAFLFSYLIVRQLLYRTFKKHLKTIEVSAIFSGLFYIFSPSGVQGWDKVIFTHNQVFLNPLIFFLILQYMLSTNFVYLLLSVFITFIFAPNFSLASAPQIFSFYPVTLLFLFIYRIFILKKHIVWKHITGAFLLFLGIHAFDLIPIIKNTFSVGSNINNAVFTSAGKLDRGLSYFSAIAPNIKVTYNMLMWPQMIDFAVFPWLYFVFPGIMLFGFFKNHTKVFLLIGIFFLVAFFLASANITHLGYSFYVWLFNIPGFSMFRNYYGQWEFLFLFFYTIVLGFSFYYTFLSLKHIPRYIAGFGFGLLIVYTAFPFINGSLINKVLWQSNNVHIFFQMDPLYENFLSYVRNINIDGKIIDFPLTDPAYQILGGKNGGAYQGPSTIAYLTGKKDFAGYDEFSTFSDTLMSAFKSHDTQSVTNILSLLNIKYLFYNKDPYIYDTTFPGFPYGNVRKYLPSNQAGYQKLIKELPFTKIYTEGKYSLYTIDNAEYLPHVYIPKQEVSVALAPADWNLALHFYQVPSNQIAFTPQSESAENTDIFKADKIDIYRNIEKDYPAPTDYPYIRWQLNSFMYPLLVWRENHQLNKFKADDDSYVDQLLVTCSKRIAEIRKWAPMLKINQNITSVKTLLTFWHPTSGIGAFTDNYNQWEASLSRYSQAIQLAIDTTNASSFDKSWKTQKEIHIREVLKYDNNTLNDVISNDNQLSSYSKRYLLFVVNDMYAYFDKELNTATYNPTFVTYEINSSASGLFTPFVEKTPGENEKGNILYSNVNSNAISGSGDSLFDQYEPIQISSKNFRTFSLGMSPTIISDTFPWKKIDKLSVFSADEKFIPDSIPWDRVIKNGYYKNISGLKENKTYLISFRYNTFGNSIKIGLLLAKNSNDKENPYYFPIFSQVKNTQKEELFNAVINTDTAKNALLVIEDSNGSINLKNIAINNFEIVELPAQPDILFKNTSPKTIIKNNTPKIVFTKINPVMYQVHVSNAALPYTLVLSEAFNNNWKIYYDSNQYTKQPIIATYFQGDNKETSQINTFANAYMLENLFKKDIASNHHFLINGYANGWTITPQDVQGKKDYTLVLEMTTERSFLTGAVISIISLVTVLFILVSVIMKKSIRNIGMKYKEAFFYNSLEKSLRESDSVLDVGCGGDSPLGKIRKPAYSEGVDIYAPSIERSKKNNIHTTYKEADILSIDTLYKPRSFDAVIALDVIEHLEKKDAIELIKKMEKIARKKVILLTPNGFYHQDHLEGNAHQEHKSGWATQDLHSLNYSVYGLRGLKYIRGEYATIKYKPWIIWGVLAFFSEYLLYYFPQFSYHLFAVKKITDEK